MMKKNEKETENVTVKKPFYQQKWFLIVMAAVIILVLAYVGMAIYFQSHFNFGTTINGVAAGGKNVEKVESLIKKGVKGYTLTLEERNEKTEVVSGEEIALEADFDGEIEALLEKQNGFAWPAAIFQKPSYALETMIVYDEDALEKTIEELDCMQKENQEAPVDASVADYTEKKGYAVIPAEQGTTINQEIMVQAVKDAVLNLAETLDLEEAECYEKPALDENDKEFQKLVEKLNDCAGVTITYEVGDAKEVLDGSTTSEWLSISDDMEVSIDEEAVAEYVSGLASSYNTCYKAKTLNTSYGSTVTISKSTYGWKVDKEGEAAQILADLEAGEDVTREIVYSQTANSHGENDYGNSYVEINLTAQHLFLYKNGELVVESDFVSGNLAKGNGSPTGVYGITYTEKGATLKGEGYATKVNYWMPFAGNVGMHDATWRDSFGGSIYKRSGSHGCINLPLSAAKTIFENVAANYPVLVYELPGTESEKGIAQDAAYVVDQAIAAIGTVSMESQATISSVRSQYDALSEEAKGYVKNYETLAAAEATLAQLQADAAAQAQAAANAAAAEQAKNEAQPVIQAINNIGTVTLESETAITNARNLYDKLSDAAKTYVTNYSVLTDAENTLAVLKEGSNS
ncbi:MAG: peptidoglycan binding domain-containing protein [Roseburia sp.]